MRGVNNAYKSPHKHSGTTMCVCLFVAGISAVIWFDEREKLPSETTLRAGCLIEVPIQTSSSLTVHC